MANSQICVLGAGSWGTALALHCARQGHRVALWTRTPDHCRALSTARVNERYLPSVPLPDSISPTAELGEALRAATLVICAIPSHAMRSVIVQARDHVGGPPPIYLCAAKGIEVDTLAHMHEVLVAELPAAHRERVAVLGGPSFAAEVAQGQPTAVVVAAQQESIARKAQAILSGSAMRAYVTDDVVGVELGGAFKNVIALAAGVCDGVGLGMNARAGLITRGLAEISRLAVALGAHPATLSGLAGLGDLVLTCTGALSRNRTVGIELGKGRSLPEILAHMGMVAEGVKNTKSAKKLALREGVDMPIVATVHAILYEGLAIPEAVEGLMGRALKGEREW